MARPRVYLAGPQVFLPDAAAVGAERKAVLAAHGMDGVFPLDAEAGLDDLAHLVGAEQAAHVFRGAVGLLAGCDAVLADLTPFRGVSADVGTAWELGFAFARGLPLFAYTTEPSAYRDRVVDPDGHRVEDFGLADNLMLESSVLTSGGLVVRGADAFTACVALAAAALGAGGDGDGDGAGGVAGRR